MDVTWLRDQRQYIIDATDAQLYDDMIRCCEADSLRAAYIMSWILIVEALRRKIFKMASLGDRRAEKAKEEIEEIEAKKLPNDRDIFEKAIACKVVDGIYEAELKYFWNERCLYAHPYSKAPTEKELIYIVTKALDMVLKSDVYYHNDRIDEIIQEEVSSFHIVPQNPLDQCEHIRHHISLIRKEHYLRLYNNLFCEFSKAIGVSNKLVVGYLALFIKTLVEETDFDINEEKYRTQDKITRYPTKIWLLVSMAPIVWDKLASKYQDSLFHYIQLQTDNLYCLRCANTLYVKSKIVSAANDAIYYESLAKYDINQVGAFYHNKGNLLARIEKEWIKTYQFATQARFIDWLKNQQNVTDIYSVDELKLLGVFLGICCRNNTFVAIDYIEGMSESLKTSIPFVGGLMQGAVKYNEALYFPSNCIIAIVKRVLDLPNDGQEKILNEIKQINVESRSWDSDSYSIIWKELDSRKECLSSQVYDAWMDILNTYYRVESISTELSIDAIS